MVYCRRGRELLRDVFQPSKETLELHFDPMSAFTSRLFSTTLADLAKLSLQSRAEGMVERTREKFPGSLETVSAVLDILCLSDEGQPSALLSTNVK